MSRSKPDSDTSNPATKWFEWDGANGNIRYYDKEAKQNVEVPLPFSFMLLDQLSLIKGWHNASDSSIYSNEVKSTRSEILVVKSFKGGPITEGIYQGIREDVIAAGGHFVSNLYIAFHDFTAVGDLVIGSLQFKGAALGAWMDFSKENKSSLYTSGIEIKDRKPGKKGQVVFNTPVFSLVEVTPAASDEATYLDETLQGYLSVYLNRPKQDDVEPAPSDDEF